jgi:hypothetical protein
MLPSEEWSIHACFQSGHQLVTDVTKKKILFWLPHPFTDSQWLHLPLAADRKKAFISSDNMHAAFLVQRHRCWLLPFLDLAHG